MSIFNHPEQLKMLQDLLNPNQRRGGIDYSSSEDEEESMVVHKLNPGAIGRPKTEDAATKAKKKKKLNPLCTPLVEEEKKLPESLEEWQDRQEKEDNDILETRKTPEYTMTYRQAVGTEDVFLQMGNRTGASASCEDLIVEVSLPDEEMTADKMSLSLQETELDLGTCLYRLRLPLPHPVNVDRCHAKYDSELKKLRLTLRLQRELDYVNF
ncbi:dynein axonemal assembly factor 6 [Drosophila santomea]|uniref:dynein axonemal assembly factor 6 n=1 Tax=Drosophila santomea TaxID=129105 RepID=UPI001954EEB4|nr:dynein axonemal assembly factor 6 [Drosophila santomea]XP_039489307.1 dynein axonemal assembly factor 6 [Drosophila santomea]